MAEKNALKIIMFLIIYALIFWVGFRSGEIHNRMNNKLQLENVPRQRNIDRRFYLVEKHDFGIYKSVSIEEISEDSVIMKFYFNRKLRPLLKNRKLKIYTPRGVRIY